MHTLGLRTYEFHSFTDSFCLLFEFISGNTQYKNWIYNKQIYFTDYGQNDDNYWFLATLTISLKSDVKIITNDEIRDHVLNILGNTGNKYTYLDLFKTKYMQKYYINKVTKKYTPDEQCKYNHTLYRLHNNYFGFPRNNQFYVL